MANRAVIAFAALEFERNHLLVLALLDHFAGHGRAFDQRLAMRQIVAVAMKQNVAKHSLFARLSIEEVDIDNVAFCNAVLPAASSDDCKSHTRWVLPGEKPRKIAQLDRLGKSVVAAVATSRD